MAAKLPQVVAVSLIKDARSYVECASALNQHLHGTGKLFNPHWHQLRAPHKKPIFFLLGQAMELALKAHLAASGVPGLILSSKEVGHDIEAAFQFAQNLAFTPADKRFPELVGWLSRPTIASTPFVTKREIGKFHRLTRCQ
jgi:hypothetical protein